MYYQALAIDYDGTLATDGQVDEPTLAALRILRASGRRLILLSGREHAGLRRVFPHLHMFDRVVSENGAVLVRPGEGDVVLLAEAPPQKLTEALRQRGVSPLSWGEVIVSSWEPNEKTVLDTIRELGLEHQVIFNKGAVMVLPPGVNKATGLQSALKDLKLSPHNIVGIGDAENDLAFLQLCGCAVAVANALPSIKEVADVVTRGARGDGVREIIERLNANDLVDVPAPRQRIVLTTDADGHEIRLPTRSFAALVAGTSGSGKSTFVQVVLERLVEHRYQYCVIDPEGDYEHLPDTFAIGRRDQPPKVSQVLEILNEPEANAAVNLLAIPLPERPGFFAELLSSLLRLRTRVGRPHWVVVDEAHHMLPAAAATVNAPDPLQDLSGMIFVTVHPDQLSPMALSAVDLVVALGKWPQQTIETFCRQVEQAVPDLRGEPLSPKEALAWMRSAKSGAIRIATPEPRGERRRHIRKYAEGQLGEDKSFYFRGSDNRLNLRAHNLIMFMQLADGVDDATWLHHLRAGDYSRWLREAIKDRDLAREAAEVEASPQADAAASRERIRAAIERRYTGPASSQ